MQYRDRCPLEGAALALAVSARMAHRVPATRGQMNRTYWAGVVRATPGCDYLRAAFAKGRTARDVLRDQDMKPQPAPTVWAKPGAALDVFSPAPDLTPYQVDLARCVYRRKSRAKPRPTGHLTHPDVIMD